MMARRAARTPSFRRGQDVDQFVRNRSLRPFSRYASEVLEPTPGPRSEQVDVISTFPAPQPKIRGCTDSFDAPGEQDVTMAQAQRPAREPNDRERYVTIGRWSNQRGVGGAAHRHGLPAHAPERRSYVDVGDPNVFVADLL